MSKDESFLLSRRTALQAWAATALLAGSAAGRAAVPVPKSNRIVVDGLDTSKVNAGFVELLRQGGVDCVHKTISTFASVGEIYRFIDENPSVVLVRTVKEIRAAKQSGKIAMIVGSQSGEDMDDQLSHSAGSTYAALINTMRAYHALGVRCQGIAYNITNRFGGGNVDDRVPLTRAGRVFVEQIHKLDMILDVGGHTGEQTSLDALAISAGVPVVCTHTNMRAMVPNYRATSDRVLEAIAATGGVVGITAISDFQMRSPENYRQHGPRSPQATLSIHLDQIEYARKLIGIDHIGLGPDFIWGTLDNWYHECATDISFPCETLRIVEIQDSHFG